MTILPELRTIIVQRFLLFAGSSFGLYEKEGKAIIRT